MVPMGRKTLIAICVVSLVLNLGLIGFLVGKTFGPDIHHDRTAIRFGASMDRILRPLGHDRARELLPITREHRKEIRAYLDEIRHAQNELYLATVEEPFDLDRLKTAQHQFNELFLAGKTRHDQMWLDIATKLEPEERQHIMRAYMPRRHSEEKFRKPSDSYSGKEGEVGESAVPDAPSNRKSE